MKFNWLKKLLSVSTLGFSIWGILLISASSVQSQNSNEAVSFRSYNFSDRYIRHKNFVGYIEPIGDELGRKDATFKIVPGLANNKCSSFESVNFPGHFLRHENFQIKLSRRINQQLFREDATFCIKNRLFGDNPHSSSFESLNFPAHYIRHKNFELWLESSDGSDLFRQDATFIITNPLYR
ncbi:AbfB domain-containing protein [Aulosira sp. FACHB-615]|uniref:AbfB domain-containing protein n=1 Tax=Aulosira sp. FACHB-615 TaxID=2692777 RepID=UPI0016858703|nr:AbfB domain-containing protein [Aulosira sp. FACHB-615]MBD2487059.1 AbfB domain-containing protein [Aulosira sp. FACHB-615]